jgi:transposase-like protein
LFNIKNKYNRFSKQIKDKIRKSKVSRGGSLRDIVDDMKTFLNLDISHQTIKNWLKIDEKHIIQKRDRIRLNLLNYLVFMLLMNSL